MNQTTNLTQWKNLTDDEKAGFDWSYQYEHQLTYEGSCEWKKCSKNLHGADESIQADTVYRLKIEPEKWYYWREDSSSTWDESVCLGSKISNIERCHVLRPAKHSEIPKPKREFKDGAFYPVFHKAIDRYDIAKYYDHGDSFRAIEWGSCKAEDFSWIGEELKIECGEG